MSKKKEPRGHRVIRVDDRIASVEKFVRGHDQALEIQFQRIAQIQADIDRIRAAVLRTDTDQEQPDEPQRGLFERYIPEK